MRRRISYAVVLAVFLPCFAAASDQTQLQILLDQVTALKQQILNMQNAPASAKTAVSNDVDTFAVSPTAQTPRVCFAPTKTLEQGDEGDDVANVQIFLSRNPTVYPEGKVTGYYGPATERAIKRLQVKYGIVGVGGPSTTGWGSIGEKTLTLLRQLWGCGGVVSPGWFVANPGHGQSPLSVVFSAQASSSRPLGASFIVDFGDGTYGNATVSNSICNSIAGPCSSIVAVGHRYTKQGNFTAKLTMLQVKNSCIAYPQACPGSTTGFCTTLPPICTSEKTNTEAGTTVVAVGTASVAVVSSLPATLKVTSPSSGSSAQLGGSLSINWTSGNVPSGANVSLSLIRVSSGANLGALATGKSPSGTFFWTLPRPAGSSGGCTGSAADCIGDIGNQCAGGICDIEPAVYRIRADLLLNGSTVVQAQSGAFAIGSAGLTELQSLPSSQLLAIDGSQTTSVTNTNINTNTNAYTNTNPTSNGAMCLYSGVSYADGISLYTNCEDAYKYSCAQVAGKHLTCRGGTWYDDSNGAAVNLPGITTPQTNVQGGCVAPWQNTPVAPNQLVPYSPYFTNGQPSPINPVPLMKCYAPGGETRSPGTWQKCDATGQTCQPYNP